MPEAAVVNASPLIFLARAACFDLLQLAGDRVHPGTEAVIDDFAARRCAATIGVPVRGTLGIVLEAKQRGIVPSARTIVEQMRQTGMYLSDEIMNQALALVRE